MKAIVRYAQTDPLKSQKYPFVVVKVDLEEPSTIINAGDTVINNRNVVVKTTLQTSYMFNEKVLGRVKQGLNIPDGEEVTLVYDCAKGEQCGYPFCGTACAGSRSEFRILEYEPRERDSTGQG